jgi:hypothetical protein
MRRTIPSFRIGSVEEQKEWKSFHQALDKSDRKTFGNMFSIVHMHNSACSFAAKHIRIQPFLCLLYFITINN